MSRFDYVIVGAGSAGCVLANRLSADPATEVLLIEAGGEDTDPRIAMPRGFGELLGDPAMAWHYPTRPFGPDRKSTRLNSSHVAISYAVFCLKKKKEQLSTNMVEHVVHIRARQGVRPVDYYKQR